MNYHIITGFLWGLMAVVWFVTALRTKTTIRRETSTNRILFVAILLVAISMIFTENKWGDFLNTNIIPDTDTWGIIGVITCACGISLSIWARLQLGENWSGLVTLKQDHTLITTGPYAITRNPIYTGIIIALVGNVFIYGRMRYALAVVIITVALLYKISREEKLLKEHFGDAFTQYAQRTKKLIPFIY